MLKLLQSKSYLLFLLLLGLYGCPGDILEDENVIMTSDFDCQEIWSSLMLEDFCGLTLGSAVNVVDSEDDCILNFNVILGTEWDHNDVIQITINQFDDLVAAQLLYTSSRDNAFYYYSDGDEWNFTETPVFGDESYSLLDTDGDEDAIILEFRKGIVRGNINLLNMDCFTNEDVYELANRIVDALP